MLTAGSVIADRFVIEKVLGEGGIARVYRVRHRQLGTVHALKVLTLQREKMSERLLLEGRIQARLRHPNIVAVTDVLAIDGRPALLMEYVSGASMEDWLVKGPTIYLDDGLALFSQILAGVHAAHLQGILHRDLKPANVLFCTSPAGVIAKVSDFGIAKVAMDEQKAGLTATGVPMGTPGYMAPEQFTDSAAADARADIFALGVMLYELSTGRQPFAQGDLLKILNATATGSYTPSELLVPTLPAHIVDAIARAMSPEPEDRFPDCSSMARAVLASHPALLEAALSPSGAPTPLPLEGVEANSTMMMPSLTEELEASTGSFSAGTAIPTPSMQGSGDTFSEPAPPPAPPPAAPPPAAPEPARNTLLFIGVGIGLFLTVSIGGYWISQMAKPDGPEVAVTDPVVTEPMVTEPVVAEPVVIEPVTPAGPPEDEGEPPEDEPAPPDETPDSPDEQPAVPIADAAVEQPDAEVEVEPEEPEAPEVAPAPTESDEAETEEAETTGDAVADADPPPEVGPSYPSLSGTWRGVAHRTPMVLRLSSPGDGTVSGDIVLTGGATPRSIPLAGRVDEAGNLSLQEPGGQGMTLSGTLSGSTLSGAYLRTGQKKSLSWNATRE